MRTLERRFGVEIECFFPQNYGDAEEWVARTFPHWCDMPGFGVGSDGSGTEIRTPILQGLDGLRDLRKALEGISSQGGYVTDSDGLHVHHDAPEFVDNDVLVLALVKAWHKYQRVIEQFVARERPGLYACPQIWDANSIRRLEDNLTNPSNTLQSLIDHHARILGRPGKWSALGIERGALNIRSLSEHGTVEFRLHEGTLDPKRAEAWVRFGQKFLDTVARKRELTCHATPQALVQELKLTRTAQETLLSQAFAGVEA